MGMSTLACIGSGKYGYVMKARSCADGSVKVVKLLSTRWAHTAVKEWYAGQLLEDHEHILGTEKALLHSDEDKQIQNMILKGIRDGTLPAKKRTALPQHYI